MGRLTLILILLFLTPLGYGQTWKVWSPPGQSPRIPKNTRLRFVKTQKQQLFGGMVTTYVYKDQKNRSYTLSKSDLKHLKSPQTKKIVRVKPRPVTPKLEEKFQPKPKVDKPPVRRKVITVPKPPPLSEAKNTEWVWKAPKSNETSKQFGLEPGTALILLPEDNANSWALRFRKINGNKDILVSKKYKNAYVTSNHNKSEKRKKPSPLAKINPNSTVITVRKRSESEQPNNMLTNKEILDAFRGGRPPSKVSDKQVRKIVINSPNRTSHKDSRRNDQEALVYDGKPTSDSKTKRDQDLQSLSQLLELARDIVIRGDGVDDENYGAALKRACSSNCGRLVKYTVEQKKAVPIDPQNPSLGNKVVVKKIPRQRIAYENCFERIKYVDLMKNRIRKIDSILRNRLRAEPAYNKFLEDNGHLLPHGLGDFFAIATTVYGESRGMTKTPYSSKKFKDDPEVRGNGLAVTKALDDRRGSEKKRRFVDVATQDRQYSLYNRVDPNFACAILGVEKYMISSGKKAKDNVAIYNSTAVYRDYIMAHDKKDLFDPAFAHANIFHYHANTVNPDWAEGAKRFDEVLVNVPPPPFKRESSNSEEVIQGSTIKIGKENRSNSGTYHIFYKDIAWKFRNSIFPGNADATWDRTSIEALERSENQQLKELLRKYEQEAEHKK